MSQDLARLEVSAVGISGKDGGLITAAVKDPALGRVGAITQVNPKVLTTLLDGGFLPVISPIALGEDGDGLNCNADDAARAVAEALGAERLVFLTDVGGILIDSHNSKTAVDRMDVQRAEELIEAGLIAGGMVPKVRGCVHAIRGRSGGGLHPGRPGRARPAACTCWASGRREPPLPSKKEGWRITPPAFFHIFSTGPLWPRQ